MSISEEIIKVLDELAKRFGLAIDWTNENVVPYVSELMEKFITYEIVIHTIPFILLIISLLCWIPIVKSYLKCIKTDNDTLLFDGYYKDPTNLGSTLLLVNLGVTVITLLISVLEFSDLIKLIIIPELYIVEYIGILL